jgi:hypothetical protein
MVYSSIYLSETEENQENSPKSGARYRDLNPESTETKL